MKKKKKFLITAIAAALAVVAIASDRNAFAQPPPAAVTPSNAQTIELTLTVGENKTIPAQDIASYSVGAPGIVDVKLSPDKSLFVFAGLRPASTTVLMLKKDGSEVTYAIGVFAKAPKSLEDELRQLLEGYTGIRIRRIGAKFFIEGGVATDADAKRIGIIAGLYPGQVESLVVAGSVGIEHTINIRVDFYFVQYDKSTSYGVGVAWPTRIAGNGHFALGHDFIANTTSATATADQLLPALDLAQTRGWAKVLKHSSVITTSGSEATFTNGGEQNFAVATGITSSIQPIKFGTNMTVLPRYDMTTHDLEVKVNASVSDLTPPVGTTSLPGRQTSDIATFVHLKLGQSIVLSGIKASSQTHAVAGVPGLSQIPVLGLLFGGHTNSTNDVEGAVFIIPSIVESVPRKAHNIVEDAMKQFEDYDGAIDQAQSFTHAPPSYR